MLLIKIPVAFVLITVLWVLLLKWCPVYVTPLMVKRSIEFRKDDSFRTQKKWVSLDRISVEMSKAAIASGGLTGNHTGILTTVPVKESDFIFAATRSASF